MSNYVGLRTNWQLLQLQEECDRAANLASDFGMLTVSVVLLIFSQPKRAVASWEERGEREGGGEVDVS